MTIQSLANTVFQIMLVTFWKAVLDLRLLVEF